MDTGWRLSNAIHEYRTTMYGDRIVRLWFTLTTNHYPAVCYLLLTAFTCLNQWFDFDFDFVFQHFYKDFIYSNYKHLFQAITINVFFLTLSLIWYNLVLVFYASIRLFQMNYDCFYKQFFCSIQHRTSQCSYVFKKYVWNLLNHNSKKKIQETKNCNVKYKNFSIPIHNRRFELVFKLFIYHFFYSIQFLYVFLFLFLNKFQ